MLSQQYHEAKRDLRPGIQYRDQLLQERNYQQKYLDQQGPQFPENSGKCKRSTKSRQRRQPVHDVLIPGVGAESRQEPPSKMFQAMARNCELLSQKSRQLESKYNDEKLRNDNLLKEILSNRAVNTVPDSEYIKEIKVLQQRLQEHRQEISKLNQELSTWKANARSREEDKIAIAEVLANAHKKIEELESIKSLTSPDAVRRIISEIEQMRVNDTERNIELKSAKRRLFNLENELSMEKQKSENLKDKLESKQVTVDDLKQRLCDISAYARTQIHNLGSELAWRKHQKLEVTIGDLPKVLQPSKETEQLQRELHGLRTKVKFQEEHLNYQTQSYESLRKQYGKLQNAFKHPNLVTLVCDYRKVVKSKGDEIKKLQNNLCRTKFENKTLRKELDAAKLRTLTTSEQAHEFNNCNERGAHNTSVRESVSNPFHSNCDYSRLDKANSCRNHDEFFFSLDGSPSSCSGPTKTRSPHEVEAGNNTAFSLCFDSSPTSSEGTYLSSNDSCEQ